MCSKVKTQYISQSSKIQIDWTVKKGIGFSLEDFTRSAVSLFLIGAGDRVSVACEAGLGTVTAEVVEGLDEGVYSLELLWVKNGDIHGTRCLQRSRIDKVFCITRNASEAQSQDTIANVKVITHAQPYGYDGLSAYEAAVLRGYRGSENAFYDAQSGGGSDIPAEQLAMLEEMYNMGVMTNRIADGAVTEDKIANNAVTNTKIAENAVRGHHIKKDSVTTDHIFTGSITTPKIADGAITSSKIANRSIGTTNIMSEAVTENEIADDAVTSDKLAEGSVEWSKLGAGVLNQLTLTDITSGNLLGTNASPYGVIGDYWEVDVDNSTRAITLPVGKTLTLSKATGYSPTNLEGHVFVDYTDTTNPEIVASVPRQSGKTTLSYKNEGSSPMQIVVCVANAAQPYSSSVSSWKWNYSITEDRYLKSWIQELLVRVKALEDA